MKGKGGTAQAKGKMSVGGRTMIPKIAKQKIGLFGDSILDCRAYVESTPGLLLERLYDHDVTDSSVECTMTCHLLKNTRSVPKFWFDEARLLGIPYDQKTYEVFPDVDFDLVVISIGGNDVFMCPKKDRQKFGAALMEGTLHDIMFSRISCVLKRYVGDGYVCKQPTSFTPKLLLPDEFPQMYEI